MCLSASRLQSSYAIQFIRNILSTVVKNWHLAHGNSKSGLCSLTLRDGFDFNKLLYKLTLRNYKNTRYEF
jgi:hypothetical protein